MVDVLAANHGECSGGGGQDDPSRERRLMAALNNSVRSKRGLRAAARMTRDRNARVAGIVAATGAAVAAGKIAADQLRRAGDGDGSGRDFRLRRTEDVGEGLRRIAAGRADSAVDQLRGHGEDRVPAAVHEARKDLKKLRSVLRLARDAIGEATYERENARFREAGRLLSGRRDDQVMVETLDMLSERFPTDLDGEEIAGVSRSLKDASKADGEDLQHVLDRAATEIEAGRAAIDDWELGASGWELVGPGATRSYRRGHARFASLSDDPSDENVHELRKRVKDHWYQLRIVRNAWREVLAETADQAHELGDLLGDHHDLAVLRDRLERAGGANGNLEAIRSAIERRQAELLADALPYATRLYAEKPKAFGRRLHSYWSAWREP